MRRLLGLSDIELVISLQAGHEKALDVLLQRYKQDIRNIIWHYTKDDRIIEDLSQEVLIKIYTSLKQKKYNEQGKFLPWALRVTRNLCLDYLKKKAQLPHIGKFLHDDCLTIAASQNAENRLVAKQQEQQLSVFINRLPDDQKRVVYYRFFEELNYKEIAVLMNTSVNTSLGRMNYALTRLRKHVNNAPSFLR